MNREIYSIDAVNGFTYIGEPKIEEFSRGLIDFVMVPTKELTSVEKVGEGKHPTVTKKYTDQAIQLWLNAKERNKSFINLERKIVASKRIY